MDSLVNPVRRGENLTDEQRQFLLHKIEQFKDSLMDKHNDLRTIHRKKQAWERITFNFNSCFANSTRRRTTQQIQTWYKNEKARRRRLMLRNMQKRAHEHGTTFHIQIKPDPDSSVAVDSQEMCQTDEEQIKDYLPSCASFQAPDPSHDHSLIPCSSFERSKPPSTSHESSPHHAVSLEPQNASFEPAITPCPSLKSTTPSCDPHQPPTPPCPKLVPPKSHGAIPFSQPFPVASLDPSTPPSTPLSTDLGWTVADSETSGDQPASFQQRLFEREMAVLAAKEDCVRRYYRKKETVLAVKEEFYRMKIAMLAGRAGQAELNKRS